MRDWINDGLMTLLLSLVSLELKRELVLGENLIDSAKLGIFLASAVSALAGIALFGKLMFYH